MRVHSTLLHTPTQTQTQAQTLAHWDTLPDPDPHSMYRHTDPRDPIQTEQGQEGQVSAAASQVHWNFSEFKTWEYVAHTYVCVPRVRRSEPLVVWLAACLSVPSANTVQRGKGLTTGTLGGKVSLVCGLDSDGALGHCNALREVRPDNAPTFE
jgi:hypothetical protein